MKPDEPKKVKKKKSCNSGGETEVSKGNIDLRMIKEIKRRVKKQTKNQPEANFYSGGKTTTQFYFPPGRNSHFHRSFTSPRAQTTTPSLSHPFSSNP